LSVLQFTFQERPVDGSATLYGTFDHHHLQVRVVVDAVGVEDALDPAGVRVGEAGRLLARMEPGRGQTRIARLLRDGHKQLKKVLLPGSGHGRGAFQMRGFCSEPAVFNSGEPTRSGNTCCKAWRCSCEMFVAKSSK